VLPSCSLPGRLVQTAQLAPLPSLPQCSRAMGPQASADDELPSLLRRSHLGSTYDHDIRFENRNAEDVHKDALAAALAEHERIREIALRAYELNELRLEQERLRQHALQEEERVRIETERAREECRLREIENKKKQIPVPVPRAKSPPPRAPSPPPLVIPPSKSPASTGQPAPGVQKAQPQPAITTVKQPSSSNVFQAAGQKPASSTKPPSRDETGSPAPSLPVQSAPTHNSGHTLPHVERYAEIHQTLKKLRAMIVNEGKQNLPFKKKTGEMRRAIRTSMGQLTGEKGSNKQPVGPRTPTIAPQS
jgi:nucleoporin GLE1